MKLPFIVVLLCLSASAAAAVYKSVLPDGTVVYSDRPPTDDATPAELPEIQFIPAPPPPAVTEPAPAPDKTLKKNYYQRVEITSPAQDGTVRDNTGTVVVEIATEPGLLLRAGHYITVYLDGKLVAEETGTQATLHNIDRGTHTLNASVNSKQGESLITSPSVTFHLHRITAR